MLLIFGYLGYDNYGDELLAKILSENLSKTNPQASIERLSKKNTLLEHLSKLLRAKEIYAIGGMFQDLSSPFSPLYYFFVLLIAKILGKKIVIKAQGLGPLRFSFNRFLTRVIFSLADEVSVRNQYSSDLLSKWKIKHVVVEDLAWALREKDIDASPAVIEGLDSKAVFVSLRTSLRAQRSNPSLLKWIASSPSLLAMTTLAIRSLPSLAMTDSDITFLEMHTGDHKIHQELLKELQKQNPEIKAYFIQAKDYKAEELIYIFKNYCSKLITMRFHARILAQIAGIEVEIINPDNDPKLSN